MRFCRKSFIVITTLAVLATLPATNASAGVELLRRQSSATRELGVGVSPCPVVPALWADENTFSPSFRFDVADTTTCNVGSASTTFSWLDSLVFTETGDLSAIVVSGSGTTAAATDPANWEAFALASAQTNGSFRVTDELVLVVVNASVELQTSSPPRPGASYETEAHASWRLTSGVAAGDTANISQDATFGPTAWTDSVTLDPGLYRYDLVMFLQAATARDIPREATATGTYTITIEFNPDSRIIVNSTGDAIDNDPGNGVCETDGPKVDGDPECTLRAAIMESNATAGLDTITFEIPFTDPGYESGPNAFRIKPQPPAVLPEITQPVIIDATTQAGSAAPATAGTVEASNARAGPRPTVILDGSDFGTPLADFGLDISAGDSEVRGLAIIKFQGHGIYLHGKGNNRVQGNLIGVEPGQTVVSPAGNKRDGVLIDGIANNVIGGLPDADRNVISNNGLSSTGGVNVHIMKATARDNVIIGNYIGTGDKGLVAMDNVDGVSIEQAPGNAVVSNVISGNQVGVSITGAESQDNRIEGNLIGIGADGSLAIHNKQHGVWIHGGSFNTIGGPTPTPGTPPGNVISGNGSTRIGHGIYILAPESKHNSILGNLIGTDQTGKLPRGNGGAGVHIELADSNRVGGPDVEDMNVIADNDSGGVVIKSNGNMIMGNSIGTDIDGDMALGNKHYGIRIHDTSGNSIVDNLVSGNEVGGILIQGADARKNEVLKSSIGTKSDRMNALGNKGPGVRIHRAHESLVERCLISGNQGNGVALSDSASGNEIELNRIGTDQNGNVALANTENGVHILNSPANKVVGNTVSGNTFAGVLIQGAKARFNTINSNEIGLTFVGGMPLGNGEDGVFLDNAPDNTVELNCISNNKRYGVFVVGGATGSIIDHNRIGTNLLLLPAGNTADGIRCQLAEKTIITDNFIASNGSNGVCITNRGVVTQDTLWNNLIYENGKNGVLISGGTQNSIRFNNIFRNVLLGIDLEPAGLTPNDETDGDTGPNNLQNFPVLKFAFEDTFAKTTTLIGFLKSTPNTTFDIDFFINADCDASGNGEGELHFDTFQVTTGMSGVTGFKQVFSGLIMNRLLTTTATDPRGNTSEFSNCVTIEDVEQAVIVNSTGDAGDTNPGDGMCDTGGTNSENETECTLRAAIQEINAQAGSQTVIFDIPGEGPHTISPATELPAVVGQAILDATTQPGFAGTPVVEIDGSGAAGTDGLTLSGGGVVVRGFVINRFNGHGIVVGGNGAHVVELNYIGTDVAGTQDLGNKGHGVRVSADNNRIGGLEGSTANVIAFNDSDGVHVAAGRANSIPRNSIHSNDRLGIDLVGGSETAEGVTSNDAGDGDTGPNDLQNFPALDRAAVSGDELEIEGTLSGIADATYRIEVFGNSECDASGFGEGRTFLGSFEVTLMGGVPAFNVTLPLDGKPPGAFITATATAADDNTSEFSACVAVETAPLVLSLGVLQNPYLSQFLDIFMVASAEVDPQSVALTVGGENVTMTLADVAENLWKGDYELVGNGTLPIEVCATSLTGSADCASTSVAALFASEGVPVDLRSADERLMIRVAGSDVTADGFVVIIPSTDSGSPPASVKDGLPVLVSVGAAASNVLAGYTVNGSNFAERGVITVEFGFKDLTLVPGTELSGLFIHHVGVGDLSSVVDVSGEVVRATAARLGTYELRVGPVGSSRVADTRFLRLDPNYPNPFNPSTTIQYELQTRQHVRLTIYDALGRRVARLVDEVVPAGIQRSLWNAKSDGGSDVASGVYFIRLETLHGHATRKLVLIR